MFPFFQKLTVLLLVRRMQRHFKKSNRLFFCPATNHSVFKQFPSSCCYRLLAILIILNCGCGTKINRVATEQLLLSDAVDRAIDTIDFSPLAGESVFLDVMYLQSARNQNLVNAEYVISSLRHHLAAARCYIKDNRNEADIIVEPRIGTLGTDGHEIIYGIPPSGGERVLGGALTGNAGLALIPEMSLGRNNAQSAMAKVIVYAYERDSSEAVWQSGIARAESTNRDIWILGAGPFQSGSVHKGVRFAGNQVNSRILSPLEQKPKEELHCENSDTFQAILPKSFDSIPAPLRPDQRGTFTNDASHDEAANDD